MSNTKLSIVISIQCLILLSHVVSGEVFTAIVEMEKLLKAEYSVAQDLKHYVMKEEARLSKLKSVADDFERHSSAALKDVEKYLGNPVNAFLLVKRFTTDWDHIINNYVKTNYVEELLSSISSKTELFPESQDLEGAAIALLRLQDTYALSTHKIAIGELQGVVNSPKMSSADCFEIGRLAYMAKDYYHTIMWMEEAIRALEREDHSEDVTTISTAEVLDYLAYSLYMQGNLRHALNMTLAWLKLEPNHERAQRNVMYYEQMIKQEELAMTSGQQKPPSVSTNYKNERPRDSYRSTQEFDTYEKLCRGEEVKVNPHAHKLTCQYRRHHPIFYLQPAKEETVFLEPWIAIYHDILTDAEIAKIKELAVPRLARATARNLQTGRYEAADYRISKSAWLKDEEDMLINRVTLKTVAMTNLTTTTVEELQVVNYGIGGHYEPHFDFARSHERNAFDEWRGNRIATVIFYMSDVSAGGATVFPDLGVKLWPKKGACAIWFNLLKNGEGDLRTRHAACPVLTGSKWVCNKWYHERGQEFVRPCELSANE